MRVRDYLKQVDGDVTFIIVDAEKVGGGFYTKIYRTTPIHQKWEWEKSSDGILDAIVVNKTCEPIDITGYWQLEYKRGALHCCMIMDEELIREMYSVEQVQTMIDHYEKKVK